MAHGFEATVEPRGGDVAVVRLAGRLDFGVAADAKRAFADAVAAGHRRLAIDLSGVGFVDSSGLSSLVSGLRATRQAGGDLRIAAPNEQLSALLSLTSLDQVFRLYPTVDEALDGYRD
jgi:anti-sigma B factor antagonist